MIIRNHCPDKKMAIDLATGTGFLADLVSQEFDKVLAFDVSASQIEVAQDLFQQKNLSF
jgi:methylase of polypeptide subunit release factors